MARGLGAYAERIDRPEEVQAALQRGVAATQEGQPALLEFITREEVNIAKRKGPRPLIGRSLRATCRVGPRPIRPDSLDGNNLLH